MESPFLKWLFQVDWGDPGGWIPWWLNWNRGARTDDEPWHISLCISVLLFFLLSIKCREAARVVRVRTSREPLWILLVGCLLGWTQGLLVFIFLEIVFWSWAARRAALNWNDPFSVKFVDCLKKIDRLWACLPFIDESIIVGRKSKFRLFFCKIFGRPSNVRFAVESWSLVLSFFSGGFLGFTLLRVVDNLANLVEREAIKVRLIDPEPELCPFEDGPIRVVAETLQGYDEVDGFVSDGMLFLRHSNAGKRTLLYDGKRYFPKMVDVSRNVVVFFKAPNVEQIIGIGDDNKEIIFIHPETAAKYLKYVEDECSREMTNIRFLDHSDLELLGPKEEADHCHVCDCGHAWAHRHSRRQLHLSSFTDKCSCCRAKISLTDLPVETRYMVR